jgi:dihydroxyacetone kinase
MKRGAQYILGMLKEDRLPTSHPVPFFAVLADAVSQSMGGTSGVLLELCFRKMSSTLLRCDEITAPNMCAAFQAGVNGVSLYGGAKEGSRTMLDAMIPASSSLASSGGDVSAAASKAREGADGTASMGLAQAGRSNYLTESTLMGTPDPGAVAVAIVLEALVPK